MNTIVAIGIGILIGIGISVAAYLWFVTHLTPNKGDIKAEPDSTNDTI
jgi:hypothetical protein